MTNSLKRLSGTLALAASVCAFAHVAARAQQAYKIDETDYTRCDLSEVPQLTDEGMPVFNVLKVHADTRVAVVVYAPQPGDATRYARQVVNWLTFTRGVAVSRLYPLYGGAAGKRRVELWAVPQGAALPPSARTDDFSGLTLFDEYMAFDGESCAPSRPAALALFAETLKRMPGWTGRVVWRPHRNARGVSMYSENWDFDGVTRTRALRRARADRNTLVRDYGLAPSRFTASVGSNDEWTHAELWLVPPGPRE